MNQCTCSQTSRRGLLNMNPIADQPSHRKYRTLTRKIKVYAPLLLRIFFVLMGWAFWTVVTYQSVLLTPPRWGWVIPLASAGLFCLSYFALRRFARSSAG